MKKNSILLSFTLFIFLSACSFWNRTTNYADKANWLSAPQTTDKAVDVFYLYPTVWYKTDPNQPNTCEINNPIMQTGSKIALKIQASAFETEANIFAPYYRQGDASYILSLPVPEQAKFLEAMTEKDVMAAFDYYIKNLNKGRPFILAGHSQGSMMLRPVLFKYMKENPDVYQRMIAAYLIGYSVTKQDLDNNPHLKFAEGSDDTGVIISYNTEAPVIQGENPVVLPGAIAINPLNWSRGGIRAPLTQNLGSYITQPDGTSVKEMNFADARVDTNRGVVICSTPECASLHGKSGLFPEGVYHGSDYAFYYYNLRQNAADRINAFLNKTKN